MNAINIIIYLYKEFSKVLFPCENQGVTARSYPNQKMRQVTASEEKRSNNRRSRISSEKDERKNE
jgi:hypothetical protein